MENLVLHQVAALESVFRIVCSRIDDIEDKVGSLSRALEIVNERLKTLAHNIEGETEAQVDVVEQSIIKTSPAQLWRRKTEAFKFVGALSTVVAEHNASCAAASRKVPTKLDKPADSVPAKKKESKPMEDLTAPVAETLVEAPAPRTSGGSNTSPVVVDPTPSPPSVVSDPTTTKPVESAVSTTGTSSVEGQGCSTAASKKSAATAKNDIEAEGKHSTAAVNKSKWAIATAMKDSEAEGPAASETVEGVKDWKKALAKVKMANSAKKGMMAKKKRAVFSVSSRIERVEATSKELFASTKSVSSRDRLKVIH